MNNEGEPPCVTSGGGRAPTQADGRGGGECPQRSAAQRALPEQEPEPEWRDFRLRSLAYPDRTLNNIHQGTPEYFSSRRNVAPLSARGIPKIYPSLPLESPNLSPQARSFEGMFPLSRTLWCDSLLSTSRYGIEEQIADVHSSCDNNREYQVSHRPFLCALNSPNSYICSNR